jgi:hypothetical protein
MLRLCARTFTFVVFLAFCTLLQAADSAWQWKLQNSVKVAESGDRISQVGYSAKGWYEAVVPGTVLTSLVHDGVYPDPMYGENNRAIPESLCRTSYWYRTEIPVSKALAGHEIWLNFEGICYCADVWVNGVQVGSIKGAFARGIFDVTKFVTPGKPAGLAVKIIPPAHPSVPHEHTMAAGTGRNGGAMGADGPAMLATVGWDWIPAIRDRDMGIWQKVTLTGSGPVAIRDPYVSCDLPLPRTDSATLHIFTDLENASNTARSGRLVGTIEGTKIAFSAPVTINPNESKTVTLPDVTLDHPKLWWPNGFGAQPLYRLKLTFIERGNTPSVAAASFGVRTIQYFRPGQKNMTILVNGVPVFCKGGNWGMDDAMKQIPYSRLDALLRLHRDANVTMIRNWIGMSTEEDFYSLCDKYGILIWDDFWIANPVDGPNPLDSDLFLANAREKILRYRNHPSICVWCGRNEGFPPPAINQGLADLIAKLDGKRFYQPHSAATNGVGGGGPYAYRKPADYFVARDSLHTEIGAPSIPTLESIEAMMPRKDWWPINDDWAEHDFCKGAQGGDRFPSVIGAKFGPVTGLVDFVRKGHLASYESYRAMFEGRQSKLWDPATGVLLWMSNPSQPSFVWQLYCYDLEQTAAYFGTQRACESVHVQMDPRDGQVIVVNHPPTELVGATVRAGVYDLAGKSLATQTGQVTVAGASKQDVFKLNGLEGDIKCKLVELTLMDRGNHEISRNFYWMGDDCTEMDHMPKVQLDVAAHPVRGDSTEAAFSIVLHNPGTTPALMAHLQMRRPDGSRVLPCAYTDNFVSLLPGETRTVTARAKRADIGTAAPTFVLDGWNVSVSGKPANGGVRVTSNPNAVPPS